MPTPKPRALTVDDDGTIRIRRDRRVIPPETWPKGRRCRHVDHRGRCITLLNQLNPGPYCLIHTRQHFLDDEEDDTLDPSESVAEGAERYLTAIA